ncbi:bacillithiol system redox-active protein YtxJ [Maribacter sp. CXY002]|uniref:bacillithiol system redox-active protein YtxJ n=1 Tax=Maribacter luteocoastalis TaxID=3407671 RepID=UPI003B672F19
MGIFSGLFGNKNVGEIDDKSSVPWKTLEFMEQLQEIEMNSKERTQVVFKHSTTCGISRMVLNRFNSGYNLENGLMDFYFLDLHANRDISNAIAKKFDVVHQSPQLLILKNGDVVAHGSHGGINEINLGEYL